MTSDHTVHNLPYGASKGALDRIVVAAATELADLGVTANVVNPGANDTGWMDDDVRAAVLGGNAQPRIGTPDDTANLVSFLLSEQGGWINGQVLHSDGGLRRG
jgi:3-oxoacyl-[acyl-carrier protein] reductase